jgi:hypothetical protein
LSYAHNVLTDIVKKRPHPVPVIGGLTPPLLPIQRPRLLDAPVAAMSRANLAVTVTVTADASTIHTIHTTNTIPHADLATTNAKTARAM